VQERAGRARRNARRRVSRGEEALSAKDEVADDEGKGFDDQAQAGLQTWRI